jgi:heme-degrading monooxygenase HmoA
MSIVVRYPPSNVTKQQYDSVRSAVEEAGEWPAPGCQIHVLFGDEQDVRVSEIWESREQFDAWLEKLGPRMEEGGIQLAGDPEIFDAHVVDRY